MQKDQPSIDLYVIELKPQLDQMTSRFIELTDGLGSAKRELGLNQFKELCSRLGIAYETAFRWIKIGGSPRIKNYKERLAGVEWGTLYYITTLSETEFKTFATEPLRGGAAKSVTRSLVKSYHQPKHRPKRKLSSQQRKTIEALLNKAPISDDAIDPDSRGPRNDGESPPRGILSVQCSCGALSVNAIQKLGKFAVSIDESDGLILNVSDELRAAIKAALHESVPSRNASLRH